MNARQTIVDILERGEATLVIHVYGGVFDGVYLDGLKIPYALHDHDDKGADNDSDWVDNMRCTG